MCVAGLPRRSLESSSTSSSLKWSEYELGRETRLISHERRMMDHADDLFGRRQGWLWDVEPPIQSVNEHISDFLRRQGGDVLIWSENNLPLLALE